jgi:hypothetical protein
MTDGTITAGAKIGSWEILSVDPTGRRVCVGCPCGGVHIFGADALRNGSATCAAMPMSTTQRAALRDERDRRQRLRDQRDWRP